MKRNTLWSLYLIFGLSLGGLLPQASLGQSSAPAAIVLSPQDKKQADDEMKQGADGAADIAKQVQFSTDKAALERVDRIGQSMAVYANSTVIPYNPLTHGFGNGRVYPFTWHFYVIEDKDVNAFSIPGGYVYVYSGLLKLIRSDDELAGVLGHEMTHAAHHHVQELSHEQSKMNTAMIIGLIAAALAKVPTNDIANGATVASLAQQGVLNTQFSQAAEYDADYGGTFLMQKAGYNPVGMLTFMERLEDLERRSPEQNLGIFRNHPYTSARIVEIQKHLTAMGIPVTPHDIRQVTNASQATCQLSTNQTTEIVYGGKTLVVLADPDGSRAKAAVDLLNRQLDGGLQMYQIRAEDNDLIVGDQDLLTLTPADAALQPGTTPSGLADQASRTLRAALWAQTVTGGMPSN